MTSTSDGQDRSNSRFTLPSDQAEATRVVFERLKKLLSDRKWAADRYRDIIVDAKASGFSPGLVRLGNRLDAMTPEKREKWVDQAKTAASLFGFAGLKFEGDETRDPKLWGFVEKGRFLRREKAEISKALSELQEAAEENSVDFQGLKHMARLAKQEPEQREDWFHRIDKLGTFLGYW